MDLPDIADANLARLRANPYPGRGIVLGLDEDGAHWVQVYWVMGRSANSRNRVLEVEGAEVATAPPRSIEGRRPQQHHLPRHVLLPRLARRQQRRPYR